jgi:hypothetical protein
VPEPSTVAPGEGPFDPGIDRGPRAVFAQSAVKRVAAPFLLASALTLPSRGLAEEPESVADPGYSTYETATLSAILAERELELDRAPEGKSIESVEIVRLEVFDETDPVPDFFNIFHVTTREVVIRRELLFEVGDRFDAVTVNETARNLRDRRQLSLVLIAAAKGSAPDRTRVIVVVKDVWSLRLNSNVAFGTGGLSYLLLNPSEENAFGTHASVGALFILYPKSYSIGLLASQRHILGTKLQGSASGSLIYNRDSGKIEGSTGYFTYGQPLYARKVEWAFGSALYWRDEISRLYEGAEVKTFDAKSTPEDDALPIEYASDRQLGGYEVTRSFGLAQKFDFSLGFEADRRRYRYDPPPGTPREAVREFERAWLPVSDTRLSPFVQFRTYSTRFFSTIELETLGLQEDFRLGLETILRFYPASSGLGSTRDLIGTLAGVSYTTTLGDGLLRALASNTVDYNVGGKRHDALAVARLRVASPRFGLGRVVFDGVFWDRYENYLRRKTYLGGDRRLRGYPENAFYGSTAVAANLELRTTSVDILSAQVGLAAFYDTGDAADSVEALSLKQSAGAGLRILFPQANRSVFRFDWAFPLSSGYDTLPGGFFVTFEQAFTMPSLEAPSVTSFVGATD